MQQQQNQAKLSKWVCDDLKKSGLSEATINEMKITEIKGGKEGKERLKALLGFSSIEKQEILRLTEVYQIPYQQTGNFSRVKLRAKVEGRKYLSPTKEKLEALQESAFHAYYLPEEAQKLSNKQGFIVLTEGEKKSAKITQELRKIDSLSTAIGFSGVTMWSQSPIWQSVRFAGKEFLIGFDADWRENTDVQNQILSLWLFLRSKKAIPKIMDWPLTEGKGIDDYLVAKEEKQGVQPEKALKALIEAAKENPFELFDKETIQLEKFAELAAKHSLSLQLAKPRLQEIWAKLKLESFFQAGFAEFFGYVKAYKQQQKQQQKHESQEKEKEIFEQKNRTFIYRQAKDEIVPFEIAAFTMQISKKIEDDSGAISWIAELSSESDKQEIEIAGTVLGNIAQFRDSIMSRGAFFYHITDTATHNQLLMFVLKKNEVQHIKKTGYLGMIEEGYLAHNALVKRNGEVVDVKACGILPPMQDKNRKMIVCGEGKKENLVQIVKNMYAILKDQSWIALGFAVQSLFSDILFKEFYFSPILFLYGKHESGKSCLARWISAFLACHKILNFFNINSTQKAYQRAGAKFKNGIVVLNEFRSNEQNNTMLCSLFDREGYTRAKKSNDFEMESGEINANFIVVSTQNLIGNKAEDALSRIVEINTDLNKRDTESFSWLQDNQDSFSCFISHCLKHIKPDLLIRNFKANVSQMRKIASNCEDRILQTHTLLYSCYNALLESLLESESEQEIESLFVRLEDVSKTIMHQTETTKASDLGQTFLGISIALVRNKKIDASIAKITADNTGEETLVFSLADILTFVRQQGKSSEVSISDERTIAKALISLGCERKNGCRELGSKKMTWFWRIKQND